MPGRETSVTMCGVRSAVVSPLKTPKLILPFSLGRLCLFIPFPLSLRTCFYNVSYASNIVDIKSRWFRYIDGDAKSKK